MTQTMRRVRLLLLTLIIAIGMCAPDMTSNVYAAAKKPAKVGGLKVSKLALDGSATTGFKVSWKKAKNASKYQVQYKKKASKKWKTYKTVKTKSVKIKKLAPATKYSFRVRGIKGKKKGKWSKVKTATTRTITPYAPVTAWPTYIDEGTIKVEWPSVSNATSYTVVCMDGDEHQAGKISTKKTSATFSGLESAVGYQIKVSAVNGKKVSKAAVYETSTFEAGSGQVLQMREPTSIYYTLTHFRQKNGAIPGDEMRYPVLYAVYYDSEGDVSSDSGYFFPKYMDVQSATIYNGLMHQGNAANPITSETTLKVGDEYMNLEGKTSKIKGLRLSLEANHDSIRDIGSYKDAYDYIEYYDLDIIFEDDSMNATPLFIQWKNE